MDKRMSIEHVVGCVESGMTIGIGGWGARRKPMALVRALAASRVTDLTIVTYGGPDVGILCASGAVRRVVTGFVTLDVIALDPHFRTARETGSVELVEYDEGMLQWGLYAATLRLPFLPTRAGLGSDVMINAPDLRTVRSPYAGEEVVAVPALELDVALVHVDRADARGNGQVLGPDPYFDDLFCGAARQRIVSTERVVATDELVSGGCAHSLLLNRSQVDGVVEVTGGAHPTSCADYGTDRDHLAESYVPSAASDEAWEAYRDRFVAVNHTSYLSKLGGADSVSAIPATVY